MRILDRLGERRHRQAVGSRLKANQHEIFALTRAPNPARLKEIGAEPLVADALDSVAVPPSVGSDPTL